LFPSPVTRTSRWWIATTVVILEKVFLILTLNEGLPGPY